MFVGPCHHGMACPQVADGETAANKSNKQSWTADKGWSFSWGLGEALTTPPHEKHV